jgi:HK97 gp10 family phage protein
MGVTIIGPDIAALIAQTNAKILDQSEGALDTVAEATKSDAMANCPVSSGKEEEEEEKEGNNVHMRDDILVYKATLERQIGTNKHYGIYVNNGTYKMKARPFLTNAFETNKDDLVPLLQSISI